MLRCATTTQELEQIQTLAAQRRQIRGQILQLGRQRRMHLLAGQAGPSTQGHTLGSAVIQVAREQVTQKGFTFDPLSHPLSQEAQ